VRYSEFGYGASGWSVGLEGRLGDLRVGMVATATRRHGAKDVGVGSRVRQIVRAFLDATCFIKHLDYRSIGTFVGVRGAV